MKSLLLTKASETRNRACVPTLINSAMTLSIVQVYDSMISKLVTRGKDRSEAIEWMRGSLYEYIISISGVKTNIP